MYVCGQKGLANGRRIWRICDCAGPPGLEPGTSVLETDVLPLKLQARIFVCLSIIRRPRLLVFWGYYRLARRGNNDRRHKRQETKQEQMWNSDTPDKRHGVNDGWQSHCVQTNARQMRPAVQPAGQYGYSQNAGTGNDHGGQTRQQ